MKDLVVLAADKDMEHTLKGLLGRPEALNMTPIEADVLVHDEHDPACALRGVDFLANRSGQYRYGLLIFDHEGSGKEATAPRNCRKRSTSSSAVRHGATGQEPSCWSRSWRRGSGVTLRISMR